MNEVIVYSTSQCPYCSSAKSLLKSLGVSFKEIGLDDKPDLWRKLSVENKGWRTVPMIFINNEFIGGYDDLNKLHKNGDLKIKLKI